MFILLVFIALAQAFTCAVCGPGTCCLSNMCNIHCVQLGRSGGMCHYSIQKDRCGCYCYQSSNLIERSDQVIHNDDFCNKQMDRCGCESVVGNCISCMLTQAPQCHHRIQIGEKFTIVNLTKSNVFQACAQATCSGGAGSICCPDGHEAVCGCEMGDPDCTCR